LLQKKEMIVNIEIKFITAEVITSAVIGLNTINPSNKALIY